MPVLLQHVPAVAILFTTHTTRFPTFQISGNASVLETSQNLWNAKTHNKARASHWPQHLPLLSCSSDPSCFASRLADTMTSPSSLSFPCYCFMFILRLLSQSNVFQMSHTWSLMVTCQCDIMLSTPKDCAAYSKGTYDSTGSSEIADNGTQVWLSLE